MHCRSADASLEGPRQSASLAGQCTHELAHRRRHRLGGRRRRRRTHVSDHVRDRSVRLVTDAGHDRHGTCDDRAGDLLGVEGHEILVGAPTAHEQDDVGRAHRSGVKPLDDRCRSALALHRDTCDEQFGERIAAPQRAHDVVNRLAARGRNHRDTLRKPRQRPLALRSHQPLGLERSGDSRHLEPQIAFTRKRQRPHGELHPPLRHVGREGAVKLDEHAAAQLDSTRDVLIAPHEARHRRSAVRDGEVSGLVAGLVVELGDLADDSHAHGLKRALRAVHRLGHRECAFLGHGPPLCVAAILAAVCDTNLRMHEAARAASWTLHAPARHQWRRRKPSELSS